jgi:hypothetical protein
MHDLTDECTNGYFETAFSEKSYEGQNVGRNAKTPFETNQEMF